jgi:flagellar basal-body rod modification protein FlgD
MTSPIGGSSALNGTTGTPGNSTATPPGGVLGKDAFFKLLVAQLKYQDPSRPADGTEFLAQTAQFTMVEKLTDMADSQQKLLEGQLMLGASNLVGKTVSYIDANGREVDGLVSSAKFTGSTPTLKVGNTDVPLSSVKEVRSSSSA